MKLNHRACATRRLFTLGALSALTAGCFGHQGRAAQSGAVISAAARNLGKPAGGVFLQGINLAGGNRFIGAETWPTKEGLDYWLGLGMNCFRLILMWENLQPKLLGPLNERNVAGLTSTIDYLTARDAYPIIDIHNSTRYKTSGVDADPGAVVGESRVTAEMLADLWVRLARLHKGNERVIFELTNEPHDQNTSVLAGTYNTVIAEIRTEGARNLILLDGNTYSGASSWVRPYDHAIPNGTAMLRIKDQGGNYAFTPHEYTDRHGGTLQTCFPGDGTRGLGLVTAWARKHGQRLLLGEFGGGDNPVCLEEMTKMIEYVRANADVWFGWTYFAAYAGQRSYNVPDDFFLGIDPPDYSHPVDTSRARMLRKLLSTSVPLVQ